jgi:hypothetical protein
MTNCCQCGAAFSCTPEDTCWCFAYPNILELSDSSCLCTDCLHEQIREKVQAISEAFTPEDALYNNPYKDLPKSTQLIEGIDYYEENGFFVFTKWYHIKRGYCCKSGCRHCAYGFIKT